MNADSYYQSVKNVGVETEELTEGPEGPSSGSTDVAQPDDGAPWLNESEQFAQFRGNFRGGRGFGNRRGFRGQSTRPCHNCGELGYWADRCLYPKRAPCSACGGAHKLDDCAVVREFIASRRKQPGAPRAVQSSVSNPVGGNSSSQQAGSGPSGSQCATSNRQSFAQQPQRQWPDARQQGSNRGNALSLVHESDEVLMMLK